MLIGRVTPQFNHLITEDFNQLVFHEQIAAEILPVFQVHDVLEHLVDVDRVVHVAVEIPDFGERQLVQHSEVRGVDFEKLARDHALEHEFWGFVSFIKKFIWLLHQGVDAQECPIAQVFNWNA